MIELKFAILYRYQVTDPSMTLLSNIPSPTVGSTYDQFVARFERFNVALGVILEDYPLISNATTTESAISTSTGPESTTPVVIPPERGE